MYHRRQAELIARRRALLIEERFVKSDAPASKPEYSPAYRVALNDWTRKIERLRANEGMSLAEASETIGPPPIPENYPIPANGQDMADNRHSAVGV